MTKKQVLEYTKWVWEERGHSRHHGSTFMKLKTHLTYDPIFAKTSQFWHFLDAPYRV